MRQRKGEQQALLLFLLSDKQYFHKVFLILSDQREMTDWDMQDLFPTNTNTLSVSAGPTDGCGSVTLAL